MKRRSFLKAGAAGMIGGAILGPRAVAASGDPPLIALTASSGEHSFMPEQSSPTRVMYYNRSIPGPVIRIPRGRESVIEFRNALDEPSTVHWHGLRVDNAMDGVPGMTQEAVEPGGVFSYRLTPPDAGTFWYHTHQRSWAQMALGLAGILIVDEENPPAVDQDLVFAVDDWRLDRSGLLDTASLGAIHDWAHGGRIGNFISVNGALDEAYPVASGERIRLRMINIANARVMQLLVNQPNLSVVAIDGQPVEPYTPEGGRILLAPGQRTDLIVDLTGAPGEVSPIELIVRDNAYQIAHFAFAGESRRERPLDTPLALAANPANRVRLPDTFHHVPLRMEGGAMGRMQGAMLDGRQLGMRELIQQGKVWALNGIAGLPREPLFRVERGTAVSIDVVNDNSWPHAMHVHGHHFVFDRSPGVWRDTALFNRGEQGSMRFVADNPGKWLLHCHMVEHMAGGMVTWFEVS